MKLGKNFKKKVLILGSSSDIGIEILKIYLEKNFTVLAHYNNGNKKFFDLVKKNKKKIILFKLNFLNDEKKIIRFFDNSLFNDCNVLINASGYIKEINYNKINSKIMLDALKVNFFPSFFFNNENWFENEY